MTKINIILLMLMMACAGCQHTRNGGVPTENELRKQEAIALKVTQRTFKQILDALNTYKDKMHPTDKENARTVVKVIQANLKLWVEKVTKKEAALGIDKLIDINLSELVKILVKQEKEE